MSMRVKERIKIFLILSLSFVLLMLFAMNQAFALPQIETIIAGSVDYLEDGATLTINASDKAIVNYSSFDIAEGESVIVNLPDSSSEFLNRVTSGVGTSILGSLYCNGIILLVNEAGLYFGPSANIDVAGLVASTRDITNSDFLSSNYVFSRLSKEQLDTLLVNEGTINIREGGFGVFIAGAVENTSTGTIIAPLGTIAIGAAEMVTLNMAGEGLISIAINKEQAKAVFDRHGAVVTKQVNNTGTISAPGGTVLIKAEALADIFELAINLDGYVLAENFNGQGGFIKIETSGKIAGSLTASKAVELKASTLNIISNSALTYIYKPGDINLTSSALQDNGFITLLGAGISVTYLKEQDISLEATGAINTAEGVVIQANSVKLIANTFGTASAPVHIDANNTYIQRLTGNIDILESLGLGSTVMLRGPPDGFGAIIYSHDTNLILDAQKVTLVGTDPTYLYGNITFTNFECTVPGKTIYFEAGYTYTFNGTTLIEGMLGFDNTVKLYSSEAGTPWYINIASEAYHISSVGVGDSYNMGVNPVYAKPKYDVGGNTGWMHNDSHDIDSWTDLSSIGVDTWLMSDTYYLIANLSSSTPDLAE